MTVSGAPARRERLRRARSHPFALGLTTIAFVALVLRVLYVELASDRIRFGLDTIWYELVSGTIVSGDGFVDPAKFYGQGVAVPTAFRPPLYPGFLALVTETIGASRHTFQLVGCVVGVATVVLVGLLGRRLAGSTVGLCAAALAAAYPILIVADGSVMSENLALPLATGLLISVYRGVDRPTVLRWMLVGLLGGACILTRGDAVVFVGLVAVPAPLLVKHASWARRAALIGAMVLAVMVVVMPWLARNHARLGTFEPATLDAATTLAGTNCDTTYSGPKLGLWDFACTQRRDQDRLDEVRLSDELRAQGLRYARDHAERLPIVASVRVLRLWGLYDPVDQARAEAVESRSFGAQMLSWLVYLPIAVLAPVGLVLLARRGVQILPLLAALAAVTLTAALAYGKQRLRIAAEPVLLVGAAVTLVRLAHIVRARIASRRVDAMSAPAPGAC